MVQYTNPHLDASFAALADVTRRGVLEQLGRAEASITDLAEKFDMTLTGMKKHVGVLEAAGLVITEKVGRVHLPDRRAPTGSRGDVDRAVSPALGRAVLRAGQGRRRFETEGEAGWTQESKVSPS
jgi:DNA-binding transcriptional ArsR family regulator